MSPILAVLNLVALLFALLVLKVLNNQYRKLFLVAMVLPIIIWFVIALISFPTAKWGLVEIIMMLLRGSLILGVLSGALACYIVTKIKQGRG